MRIPIGLCVLWITVAVCGPAHAGRTVPDLGLVLNLDGDNAYPSFDPEESVVLLREEIDRLADLKVRTLAFSIGSGSEILLYPTQVANTWGWRETSYNEDPRWGPRIARNKANQDVGADAIRVAGERAKQREMYFFPSYRMNDLHYAFGQPPEEYPLSGSFWLENRDLVVGESPIRGRADYAEALDYSHAAVRQYRLAVIFEAIERYQDIMDGFEMDFTRFQIFFPPDMGPQRGHLITEMVRQVRSRLMELEEENGRPYYLIARVPTALANCRWAGLEVERWVEEGLVDVLAPSQMMTTAFEMPVDEFMEIARPAGIRVYATLMARVVWRWEFAPEPAPDSFGSPSRALMADQLRAAVTNMRFLGADGIYLFNFQHHPLWNVGAADQADEAVLTQLAAPDSFARQNKVFTITKSYWYDHEDTYQYRKALPAELSAGTPRLFQMLIGENLSSSAGDTEPAAALRVGLRGVDPGMSLAISVNGRPVLEGSLEVHAIRPFDPQDQAAAALVERHDDLASHILQVPIDLSLLQQGQNRILLEVGSAGEGEPLTVTDIEIGIFYNGISAH